MSTRLAFSLVSLDIDMVAIFPLTALAQSKRYNYVLSRTMLDSTATSAVVSVNYYNSLGALTSDRNRGIANIDYDNLNNPTRIQFTDGSVTEYLYTAEGEKLMVTHTTAAPGISAAMGATQHLTQNEILSTDSISYIGDLRICNGIPDMLRFGGGYISLRDKSTAGPVVALHYYNYDHLGNVRDVVSEDGTIEQTNDYYPFGATYGNGSSEDIQPYKYCGKELDRMYGLDTYDHGARQNYSILGVWDRIDPMAEKYYWISPYAVCGDNPANKIDPSGRDSYYTQDGEYAFTNMSGTDFIYIISKYEFIKTENNKSYYYVYDRHRLDETTDFLQADAYSKIFTNILERFGVLENDHKIYKDAIQVFVGKQKESRIYTYSKSERNGDANEGAGQLAHTSSFTHKITANIWDNKINTGIGIYKDNRVLYATEHNVLSILGDHEYKGHYVMGISSESRAYNFQEKTPNWSLISQVLKSYIKKFCIK